MKKLLLPILTIGCLVAFLSFRLTGRAPGEFHLAIGLPGSPWLSVDKTDQSASVHVELFSWSWLFLIATVALLVLRRRVPRTSAQPQT